MRRVRGAGTQRTGKAEARNCSPRCRPPAVVDYERAKPGSPYASDGYAVWKTTSAAAPDYLKSFRAPVATTDPVTDAYLREWSGDASKLIDFSTFETVQSRLDDYYEKKGYPIQSNRSVPLVVTRQNAASWEALSIRERGTRPHITTFSNAFDGAVVAVDRETVLASIEVRDDLSDFVGLSDMVDSPIGGQVIEFNMLKFWAPVESIFDEYVDSGRRNAALTYFNNLFRNVIPTDACRAYFGSQSDIQVECTTHTVNYSPRMDKLHVSSLFLFIIGPIEVNGRSITVVQESIGAAGANEGDLPSPSDFKISPEGNAGVKHVQRALLNKMKRLISGAFPAFIMGPAR